MSLFSLALTSGVAVAAFSAGWFICQSRYKQAASPAPTASKKHSAVALNEELIDGECKLVLVARTDLKMGPGKMAAQCCHAAVGCARRAVAVSPKLEKAWKRSGEMKVVLKVQSEEDLYTIYTFLYDTNSVALQEEALKAGLNTYLVADAGRTQIAPGSKTVLGIGPAPADRIDPITGHLKLM